MEEIIKFEAGNGYGRWYDSAGFKIAKRTNCYVWINDSVKKRIKVRHVPGYMNEPVETFDHMGKTVWACCKWAWLQEI